MGVEERDTLISVVPALTLMATSNGLMPAAGICFSGIRFFFFFPLVLEERKNQYLGAQHDRGIISELKGLSFIVIWRLLFAIVLLSPHFSLSLLFLSLVSSPAHCLNSPGDILCCNLKTRGQEIKCKRISLKPIGGLLRHLLLFSCPHPPFLISFSCLPRSPTCSWRNLFVVHLHSLIPDKDKPDVSPSVGQFFLPVCKRNPLGALVDGCEKLEILAER